MGVAINYHQYQLSQYLRIYRRRRSRRRLLLATKLATLIQLKVVYMKVSGRTSSFLQYSCKMPKIGQQRDTTHATEATPTTSSPSSRKFWYSLTVSNPLTDYTQKTPIGVICSQVTKCNRRQLASRIWLSVITAQGE